MSLSGGKRKANNGLKAWVAFVKKVQKEEKLSYKDAIHRAKVRKDKGEKWMKKGGGEMTATTTTPTTPPNPRPTPNVNVVTTESDEIVEEAEDEESPIQSTGHRRPSPSPSLEQEASFSTPMDISTTSGEEGSPTGGKRRRRTARRGKSRKHRKSRKSRY